MDCLNLFVKGYIEHDILASVGRKRRRKRRIDSITAPLEDLKSRQGQITM